MARQAVLQLGPRPATYGRWVAPGGVTGRMTCQPLQRTQRGPGPRRGQRPTRLPGAARPRAEGGDASTVGGWTLKGGRNPLPWADRWVLRLKRSRTPGPYKARGPTTRPPETPRNSHFSRLRVNRQHQTERSGKVRRSGVAKWVTSCQIWLLPDSARREVLAPPS